MRSPDRSSVMARPSLARYSSSDSTRPPKWTSRSGPTGVMRPASTRRRSCGITWSSAGFRSRRAYALGSSGSWPNFQRVPVSRRTSALNRRRPRPNFNQENARQPSFGCFLIQLGLASFTCTAMIPLRTSNVSLERPDLTVDHQRRARWTDLHSEFSELGVPYSEWDSPRPRSSGARSGQPSPPNMPLQGTKGRACLHACC